MLMTLLTRDRHNTEKKKKRIQISQDERGAIHVEDAGKEKLGEITRFESFR